MNIPVFLYGFSTDLSRALASSIRSFFGEAFLVDSELDLVVRLEEEPLSIFIADIHAFKLFNDRYPHPTLQAWKILVFSDSDLRKLASSLSGLSLDSVLVWPFPISELASAIREGKKKLEIRKLQTELLDGENHRLQETVDHYRRKETLSAFESELQVKRIFHNMKTVLGQGQGFGALISMSDMIARTDNQGCHRCLPEGFRELLTRNVRHAERVFEAFHELDNVIQGSLNRVPTSTGYLLNIYNEVQGRIRNVAGKKSVGLIVSTTDLDPRREIRIDHREIEWSLQELLLNAIRFSPEKKDVFCILRTRKSNLEIAILNSTEEKDGMAGIPVEFEKAIFEPFFRMNPFVSECEFSLDYGLGLTRTKKIIEKHGGTIRVSNIKNHLPLHSPGIMVFADVKIPLEPGSAEGGVHNQNSNQLQSA